jgi:hypothetical protein
LATTSATIGREKEKGTLARNKYMPDPNDTNPVTQIRSEEKEAKHRTRAVSGWKRKAVVGLASLPAFGLAGNFVWNSVIEYGKEINNLKTEVEKLKNTNSQWTALADHESRIRQMEPQMGIVMWLLEHGKIKEVEKTTDVPLRIPRLEAINVDDFKKYHDERSKASEAIQLQMKK